MSNKTNWMSGSEKSAARPGNEARTKANKARRQARHESRIQRIRDRFREGLTVREFKQLREQRGS